MFGQHAEQLLNSPYTSSSTVKGENSPKQTLAQNLAVLSNDTLFKLRALGSAISNGLDHNEIDLTQLTAQDYGSPIKTQLFGGEAPTHEKLQQVRKGLQHLLDPSNLISIFDEKRNSGKFIGEQRLALLQVMFGTVGLTSFYGDSIGGIQRAANFEEGFGLKPSAEFAETQKLSSFNVDVVSPIIGRKTNYR